MKELRKPKENIFRLLGPGSKKEGQTYRKSAFFLGELFPDGAVIYHTLLKCLAFVSREGFLALSEGREPADEEEKAYFYAHYFLIPEDTDELKNAREIRELLRFLEGNKKQYLKSFTILPTTDCNARCFYCYEAGCEKMQMSSETADDVAVWIMKQCPEKEEITLQWFGGEPLYNMAAIDRITGALRDAGRNFSSGMISNGYLFDEETVTRAKNGWKLKNIQITLDGTEAVYNERKNYIYKGESAYRRVLRNIALLEKAEIKVDIRLNLDGENAEDLKKLTGELSERFRGSRYIRVYTHLLYQVSGEGSPAYRDYFTLKEEIAGKGLSRVGSLRDGMKISRCMADSDRNAVILPDGRLFRCEHFNETLPSYGSIYSEEEDKDVLEKWHEYYEDLPECAGCFYYPDCLRLKHCPEETGTCLSEQREIKRALYLEGIRKEYKNMKEKE